MMKWTAVADCTVAEGQVKFENIEADSMEEAFDIAYGLAKECPTAGDEIVNIYSGHGTEKERQGVYDIVSNINASQNTYWNKIKK